MTNFREERYEKHKYVWCGIANQVYESILIGHPINETINITRYMGVTWVHYNIL